MSVVCQLHFDGDFVDQAIGLPLSGGGTISSDRSKFGGTSGLFVAGSGDPRIRFPCPSLRLGRNDFTIEGWFYPSVPNTAYGIAYCKGANTTGGMFLAISPTRVLFRCNGVNDYSAPVSFSDFAHVAICRKSDVLMGFFNGIKIFSAATVFDANDASNAQIGAIVEWSGVDSYAGYIDEFQVLNGVCKYDADFAVPTAPFPTAAPTIIRVGNLFLSGDTLRGGLGIISSTVKIHGTSDVPAARKVGLFLRRTMERVAITWSDPVTGIYTFSGLQTIEPFFIASLDHTLAFDGVLHDNIMAVAP